MAWAPIQWQCIARMGVEIQFILESQQWSERLVTVVVGSWKVNLQVDRRQRGVPTPTLLQNQDWVISSDLSVGGSACIQNTQTHIIPLPMLSVVLSTWLTMVLSLSSLYPCLSFTGSNSWPWGEEPDIWLEWWHPHCCSGWCPSPWSLPWACHHGP